MKPNLKKRLITAALTIVMLISIIPAHAAVSDVKPGTWAYDAVQYNVENKLIAIDHSKYNMNAPAPRQDVAYALYKLTNGKDTEPTAYPTVPEDMKNSPAQYKYSVQWAVEHNVINGTKNENGKVWFSPTTTIDREQMATLLYRLAQHDGLDTLSYSTMILNNFTDGRTAANWAKDAMAWCVTQGIMNGTGKNKLSPKMTLSYGQLAQFMKNYGDFKAEHKTPEPTETPTPTPTETPTPTPGVTGNSGSYYNQVPHPENANKTDWLETYQFTDLSGPWDGVEPVTELPIGGYMKNGYRYNRYGAPLDISDGSTNPVDGIPTDDEKKALILINQHRLNNGLEPLKWDQAAQVIAETRAIESRNFHTEFNSSAHEHTRPNGDSMDGLQTGIIAEWSHIGALKGTSFNSWCYENAFSHCPEYFEGYDDLNGHYSWGHGPRQIVKGWIESKGHNAALKWDVGDYAAVAASHFETDIRNGEKDYYWYYDAIEVY